MEAKDIFCFPETVNFVREEFHGGVFVLGDCIGVMDQMLPWTADAIITDPPFGTTNCKWDAVIPFDPMWDAINKIAKPWCPTVLFAMQPFTSALVMSNPKKYRYSWVYEKTTATGHLNAKKMPMRAHEDILVFYSQQPVYNPQKTTGHVRKTALSVDRAEKQSGIYGTQAGVTSYDSTERYPRSVIKFSTDKQTSNLHPTQKPINLMRYLIRTYTQPGDVVLDFTCGSGTTCFAAVLEGRKFVGIEKEQKYFDIACQRLEKAEGPIL